MTEKNKEAANSSLEKLTPSGCTNLWDGLVKALKEIESN